MLLKVKWLAKVFIFLVDNSFLTQNLRGVHLDFAEF